MIYNINGQRKYLTRCERNRFILQAAELGPKYRTFCLVLAFSGCRLSEALNVTRAAVDPAERVLIIHSLKKRDGIVLRAIPLPDWLIGELVNWADQSQLDPHSRLWGWSRTKGWMVVKDIMQKAAITGEQASPKGLRHSFGVEAVRRGIPLNIIQRWLGHAKIETTSIYTNVVGKEERELAQLLWATD